MLHYGKKLPKSVMKPFLAVYIIGATAGTGLGVAAGVIGVVETASLLQ